MEPYHININREVIENDDYRRVLYTVPKSFQLVCMSIPVGDNIHTEIHPNTTQFIMIEKGLGIATVSNKHYALGEGVSITIPPDVVHKIENVGDEPLKLYTIYAPPEHPDGLIQHTNPDLQNESEERSEIKGVVFTIKEIKDLVEQTKDITHCDVTRDAIIKILYPDDEFEDELLFDDWKYGSMHSQLSFAEYSIAKINEKLNKNGVCFVHIANSSGVDDTLLHVFALFKTSKSVYRVESYGKYDRRKKKIIGASYCTRAIEFKDYEKVLSRLISMEPGPNRVKLWNDTFSTDWPLDIDTEFEMDVILMDLEN